MNERTIFLFDGIGATSSFVLSGLILPRFSEALGLSKDILYFLAAFPAVYLLYSFSCFALVKKIKGWMLLTIISANFAYCLISGGLIIFHDGVGELGKYLLFTEVVVVIAVIVLELKVYQKHLNSR